MISEDVERRFWAKVAVNGPDECWPWMASKGSQGYGQLNVAGKPLGSHVISYLIANGELFGLGGVLHTCHNKACCNPRHLKEGNQSENMLMTSLSGRLPRNNQTGIAGVCFLQRRQVFFASARKQNVPIFLYEGKDFFKACCARKSWEAQQKGA